MKSFVLRFEEERIQARPTELTHHASSGSGFANGAKAIPLIVAGTKTLTEVKQEGTDADPRSASFHAFPKSTAR